MAKPASETSNTFKPDVVQSLVGKIEEYFADIETERGKFMKRCRDIRDRINAVYDEADARGMPKKELRTFVRARGKIKDARQMLDELKSEQRETVEMLAEAFGDAADLPLFADKVKKTAAKQAAAEAGATH